MIHKFQYTVKLLWNAPLRYALQTFVSSITCNFPPPTILPTNCITVKLRILVELCFLRKYIKKIFGCTIKYQSKHNV